MKNFVRQIRQLENNWRFSRGNMPEATGIDFDDHNWETVNVPHDFAIAGPFARENGIQISNIPQDGIWDKREFIGRTGCLPHEGIAWYRLLLSVPETESPRRYFLEFDGVMANSEVFVNGQSLGCWPYGYASFMFEATWLIKPGNENLIAVRIEGKTESARWYPGAGIYRNVRLVVTAMLRIAHWGVTVTTPLISRKQATVNICTELDGDTVAGAEESLKTTIIDPDGNKVAESIVDVSNFGDVPVEQQLKVAQPRLWDVDTPELYTVVSELLAEGSVIDQTHTTFGIRTIIWDADDGFVLNGRTVKLNGVCMHHDLGPLGAAHNQRALERQWDLLMDMGCNALRTSHNPPSPELLDLCDRRGILVLDEAFDEWKQKKVVNGYNSLFEKWAEKDLRAMIHRDRNHPCIIAWSLGNEIPEQHEESCRETAGWLKSICRQEDPTRLVTAGCNPNDEAVQPLSEEMDVAGMNYSTQRFEAYRKNHPDQPFYSSESESCVSSRGEYFFPVEQTRGEESKQENLQISSYDMALPAWGNPPDIGFARLDANPFVAGEFVWTGFDYLGEPSPYYTEYPVRSSFFGILDLCGFPKDRFYLYRSRWRPDTETLHLLPHWNWEGREGEITPVHCYTNYNAAELFLNGVSQGVRRKDPTTDFDRYRLRWNEVRYEPGVLKVVALDDNGNRLAEAEMCTAGNPAQIELTPDRNTIANDGKDLSFVTVRILDSDGILCPKADCQVSFTIIGSGEIVAVGNGNPSTTEPFQAETRLCFNGLCLAIVRFKPGEKTPFTITATANGLSAAKCLIQLGK